MKIILVLFLLVLFFSVTYAQYDGYSINPEGTYVCSGAYDGYRMNPDGTYVCGGMKSKKK